MSVALRLAYGIEDNLIDFVILGGVPGSLSTKVMPRFAALFVTRIRVNASKPADLEEMFAEFSAATATSSSSESCIEYPIVDIAPWDKPLVVGNSASKQALNTLAMSAQLFP